MQGERQCSCPLAGVCQRGRGPFRETQKKRYQILFVQSTPAEHIYFVKQGAVSLHRMSSEELALGRTRTLRHHGHFLGAEALITSSYQDSARAETDLLLCVTTREQFSSWIGPKETPAYRVLESLLLQEDEERVTLADPEGNAHQRVACWLVNSPLGAESLSIDRSVIADLLSMRAETLSRVLHDFAVEGLLEVSRHSLLILDFDELRNRSNVAPSPSRITT